MQTRTLTFSFSFHISFLLLLPVFFCQYLRLVFLSCSIQGFRLKKLIYSSFISLFCFFFHIPFYTCSLSISPSATHFYIMTLPLSALHTRPSLSELFFLPSHFLPLSSAPTHQGPREGKWKVYVFCSSAVWQWEAKLLFYGFIYGSVDFWRCAHHIRGAEGEWRGAWSELLLVPPVELDQQGGMSLDQICISYNIMWRQTHTQPCTYTHSILKYSWQDINFHKHINPINLSTPLLHLEKHMNNDISLQSPSNIKMYNLLSCLFVSRLTDTTFPAELGFLIWRSTYSGTVFVTSHS